jgi:predicted nucleic acid-binding protein
MAIEVILDSSIIVALVTLEEYSNWASESVQEHGYCHILDLSFYEVANALRHKVSDRFSQKDAATAFRQAEKMMNLYAIHDFSGVIVDALNKALDFDITVYDAAFLSLVERLDMHLLTLDMKLAKKLERTKYCGLIECPNQ